MKTLVRQRAVTYANTIGVYKRDNAEHWQDVIRAYTAGNNGVEEAVINEVTERVVQWVNDNFLGFVSVCDGKIVCTLTKDDIINAIENELRNRT